MTSLCHCVVGWSSKSFVGHATQRLSTPHMPEAGFALFSAC